MFYTIQTTDNSQSSGYAKLITINKNRYTYPDVRGLTRVNCNGSLSNLIVSLGELYG